MVARISGLAAATSILVAGCSSLILSSSAPPAVYQLDYRPVVVKCPHAFHQGVRVWRFTNASPFDEVDMVVEKEGGEILYSDSYQWAASPGAMLADSLLRDLSQGSLFPEVVSSESPLTLPLQLTGRVFSFTWEEGRSAARAMLQVDVQLSTATEQKVIFHQVYNLQSEPFAEKTAAVFARAMSGVAGRFSERLQKDLCTRAVEQ